MVTAHEDEAELSELLSTKSPRIISMRGKLHSVALPNTTKDYRAEKRSL